MINENGKLQCRFCFPMRYISVTSLADGKKTRYRRHYYSKLNKRDQEEFSHNLAVYQKHSDNQRSISPLELFLHRK